jgi:hypothetical protein
VVLIIARSFDEHACGIADVRERLGGDWKRHRTLLCCGT